MATWTCAIVVVVATLVLLPAQSSGSPYPGRHGHHGHHRRQSSSSSSSESHEHHHRRHRRNDPAPPAAHADEHHHDPVMDAKVQAMIDAKITKAREELPALIDEKLKEKLGPEKYKKFKEDEKKAHRGRGMSNTTSTATTSYATSYAMAAYDMATNMAANLADMAGSAAINTMELASGLPVVGGYIQGAKEAAVDAALDAALAGSFNDFLERRRKRLAEPLSKVEDPPA